MCSAEHGLFTPYGAPLARSPSGIGLHSLALRLLLLHGFRLLLLALGGPHLLISHRLRSLKQKQTEGKRQLQNSGVKARVKSAKFITLVLSGWQWSHGFAVKVLSYPTFPRAIYLERYYLLPYLPTRNLSRALLPLAKVICLYHHTNHP